MLAFQHIGLGASRHYPLHVFYFILLFFFSIFSFNPQATKSLLGTFASAKPQLAFFNFNIGMYMGAHMYISKQWVLGRLNSHQATTPTAPSSGLADSSAC
jgi:hypothetical protein